MNKNQIKEVLLFLLKRIENLDVRWRLGGSVNMFVQGMDLNPRDVDVMPDNKSFYLLKEELHDYIDKEGYKEELKGPYFNILVGEFELDFFVFDDERKSMIDKAIFIEWEGLKLPVLLLCDTIEYFKETNRHQKAEQIRQFLVSK